jgi:hypothetical protein
LAALPVVGSGDNLLPTIHVADLAKIIDAIFVDPKGYGPYLLAVDNGSENGTSTSKNIMTAIS